MSPDEALAVFMLTVVNGGLICAAGAMIPCAALLVMVGLARLVKR